ncbi:MAG: TolC family protein [Pirellulales bacterium]
MNREPLGQGHIQMRRRLHLVCVLLTCASTVVTGCTPQQPYYLIEDGDLSHYVATATDLDNPDMCDSGLAEVMHPDAPRSLANAGGAEVWRLTLEEAVSLSLANSKVFRQLGGRIIPGNSGPAPDTLLRNPDAIPSVYMAAIQETVPGGSVEWALGAFDAQLGTSMFWEKNSSPRNNLISGGLGNFFANTFEQDLGTGQVQLSKTGAGGTRMSFSSQSRYEQNNIPSREVPSDWQQLFDVRIEQPLLQGGGVLWNRIAGPEGQPGNFNGVMISRIRTDIRLADFEAGVRNLVNDVELAYWNLYFSYRNLDAARAGRDSALATWQKIYAFFDAGDSRGNAESLAQAKEQYFLFRGLMENALTEIYRSESRLRYIMGLAATDERLIKPADEPTTAPVTFDWQEVHAEALARSVELRQERWRIKQRELELIAAKNLLLPQLNAVARYRWEGLGDQWLSSERSGSSTLTGSSAFERLTDGDFQSWQLGFNFNMALGRRREMLTVRHQEYLLARERAMLEDQELEVSHQMADAIRELEGFHRTSRTAYNRRIAAKQQVDAVVARFEAGTAEATVDLVLDAQRRLADADTEYYRTLVNYNTSILNVHFRKNSLLEYNGIYLAEGPWPGKAYFDAHRLARQRDASVYADYGLTQPEVISRGPILQGTDGETNLEEVPSEVTPNDLHTLPPPSDAPGDAPSDSPSAVGLPPLPKTASRGVKPSSFATAPVGPKSDGRSKRPASGSKAGAKATKFDWGNVGDDTRGAINGAVNGAAAPLPKTTGQSSRAGGNVLRQQSNRTGLNSENRTVADATGPNPTSAAIARPSANRPRA